MHCVDTTPKVDYAPTPACRGRVPWPSVREITGLPTMFSAHTSLNYSNFLHEQTWFATNISSISKTIDMSGMKKWSCLFRNSEQENKGFCFFFPSLISTHSLKFRDVFWFRRLFGQKLVSVTTNLQISIRKPWPQIFIGITSKKPSILLMFHLEDRSFYNAMSQLVGPVHDQFIEVENGPPFPHTGWSGK
jgi:hypothetical protein